MRFWGALTDELRESFLQLGPLDVLYDRPEDTLSTPEAAPDRTASAVGSAPGQPVAPSPPAPDPSQATGAPPQYRDWAWGAGPARGPRFWDASQAAQRHRASQRGPRGSDHPSPTGPPTHSQSGGGVKRCRSAEPPPIPPVDPPTPCQPHGPETEALQDLTQPPPKGPGTHLAPWVTHDNLDATDAGIDHDISEHSAARPPDSPHHAAPATGPPAGGSRPVPLPVGERLSSREGQQQDADSSDSSLPWANPPRQEPTSAESHDTLDVASDRPAGAWPVADTASFAAADGPTTTTPEQRLPDSQPHGTAPQDPWAMYRELCALPLPQGDSPYARRARKKALSKWRGQWAQ